MDLPEVSRLARWDIECAVRDIPFHSHTPISAASEWGSQWRRGKVRLHPRWQFLQPHKFRVRHDFPGREVARVRINVADLWRADDLPLGVTRVDLVSFSDVPRLEPLAGHPVAVAEGKELEARHVANMP